MKKWMKSKKSVPTNKPDDRRCAFVRGQIRKFIDGIEAEFYEVSDHELWRTQHHKKSKQTSYEKFSYV
jgi:hypothetical protein